MRRLAFLAAVLVSVAPAPLRAESATGLAAPYFDGTTIDLTQLLPPPPPADGPQTKAELGDLLVIQVTRTPDMVGRAQADAVEEVWRFADVLGPKFAADTLPKTAALFERLVATDNAVLEPAKARFARQRPYMVSDLIRPVVKTSTSGSWPSSHASLGTVIGIVLSDMVPEKRAALMERARSYGENRLVAGAHFPSDVEMGRISGTVIAAIAMSRPEVLNDFNAARAETRAALGLN